MRKINWVKLAFIAYVAFDFLTPAQFGIFTADAQGAQPTMQFPTTGWQAYAPALVQCGTLLAANMNSTSDQAIQISVPTSNYVIDAIEVSNASISLTTAQGGFYPAVSKGGSAIVANSQAYSTLTAAAVNAAGSTVVLSLSAATTTMYNLGTIYLSLTTAQGAAATADVRVRCRPLYTR